MVGITLRSGIRSLLKSPAFFLGSTISLGVGLGLVLSVASVLEAGLRPPIPYEDPEELVEILPTSGLDSQEPVDYGVRSDLALRWMDEGFRTLETLAGEALALTVTRAESEGLGRPDGGSIDVRPVIGDWFGLLGVSAARGRVLTAADVQAGEPVLVVSDRFRREELGEAADPLGMAVSTSLGTFTVVGVMPPDFSTTATAWVPSRREMGVPAYRIVGRLRSGSSSGNAELELSRIAATWGEEEGVSPAPGAAAAPVLEAAGNTVDSRLWILAVSITAVLLIGAMNLTNLFLARAETRRTGLAIRVSLGATRFQLLCDVLAEGLIVGIAGASVGLLLASWGKDLVFVLTGGASVYPAVPTIGATTVGLALALVCLLSLLIAAEHWPRFSVERLAVVLRRRSEAVGGTREEGRARDLFLAAQIGGAVVLVTVTGLLLFAARNYRALDLGHDPLGVLQVNPDFGSLGMDRATQWELGRQMLGRLPSRPDVEQAAAMRATVDGWPPTESAFLRIDQPGAGSVLVERRSEYLEASPGLFELIDVPIVRGRSFNERDDAGAAPVAIVNRAAEELWWPGEDALGQRVQLGREGEWVTVVGVADIPRLPTWVGRLREVQSFEHGPLLFRPIAQSVEVPPGWMGLCGETPGTPVRQCRLNLTLLIRGPTGTEVEDLADVARSELAFLAPGLEIAQMGEMLDLQMGPIGEDVQGLWRLVGAAGLVGVLLALLGVVAVVSDRVSSRTKEIGLRMALGARGPQVLAAILRRTGAFTLIGLAFGVVALLPVRELLSRISIFELIIDRWRIAPGPFDGLNLSLALGGLAMVVWLVAAATGARALAVSPAEAMREE